MKMTLEQTKLVGLTMELELKTREYKMLCDKLENYKQQSIDPNAKELIALREEFIKNNKEITEINEQLKKLQAN